MDLLHKLLLVSALILGAAIDGALADAMVTGSVFCDQCKDGQKSFFDFPLSGIKVTMACHGSDGQMTLSREDTTNWFGNYAMRLEGTPDLSGCYAQVSGSDQSSNMGCGAAAGPAQNLRLVFRMFDTLFYSVDALLSQPAQPMSLCPKSTPVPAPVTPVIPPPYQVPTVPPAPPMSPPPYQVPTVPRLPPMSPLPPVPQVPPLPPMQPLPPLPRMPPLPPLPPMPPMPFFEASACSHENWTTPQYKCYWRAVNPDTKVAVIFGLIAARRYGTDMTLWEGLQGRGDPYRTLLREGITAFLNSYNSLQFSYHTLGVLQHMNEALLGSTRNVLMTALRFHRANSGSGNVACKFTPCK